jgi:hypothetical protein
MIMKKIIHIILTILFVMSFTESSAQTVALTVQGQISPVNGPISVIMTYDDAGMFFTATMMTDISGNFFYTDSTITGNQGIVIVTFDNCSGNSVSDTTFYSPTSAGFNLADFGIINYCTNSGVGTSTVSGVFSSITSPISFTITLDNGTTYQNITTTPNGAFSESYNFLSGSGTVYLQYMNCNGDSIFISTSNISGSPTNEVFNFGTIDYCPTTGAVTSTVTGVFSSITSPVTFTITLDNGTTYQSITTTPNGAFNETYNFLSGSGTVYLQYMDCNGDSIFVSATNTSNIPGNEVFDFGTIDYCPTINPQTCVAGFSLSQNIVIDSFNNIVSTGNVMIVNTSTGQNLGYSWDFGDNSPTYYGLNFLHTYPSAGPWVLCLTITDPTGACSDTFCDSIMVDTSGVLTGKTNGGFTIQMGTGEDDTNGPNSINDIANQLEVSLFPNPANNEVILEFNSKISDQATIIIYNSLGSIVKYQSTEITTGDQTISINIEDLNSGLFIIQLQTKNGNISNKLIKK